MKFKPGKEGRPYRKLRFTDCCEDRLIVHHNDDGNVFFRTKTAGKFVMLSKSEAIQFALVLLDELDPLNGGEGWK